MLLRLFLETINMVKRIGISLYQNEERDWCLRRSSFFINILIIIKMIIIVPIAHIIYPLLSQVREYTLKIQYISKMLDFGVLGFWF